MFQDPPTHAAKRGTQRGAALLAALLTVALVAVFASQAFWEGWRGFEQESQDRTRLQGNWVVVGALDWARAQLREDGLQSPQVDHAGEAWARPTTEVSLSTFLSRGTSEPPPAAAAAPANAGDETLENSPAQRAFVTLQLSDAQGKLNALNLLEGEALSPAWLRVFERLFELLNLPPEQLALLAARLRSAHASIGGGAQSGAAPLVPQQPAQLAWLGLEPATLAALQAHVTLLPARTAVNLNSASPEVLMAVVPGWQRPDAERLVMQRQLKPLQSVAEASLGALPNDGRYSVNSRFFELQASFRLGAAQRVEHALLQRDAGDVRTLWRRPGLPQTLPPAPSSSPLLPR